MPPSTSKNKFEFLLPGESDFDYVEYFKQLQFASYHGPVVVAVSAQLSKRAGYDPVASARRSYENMPPALRKASLRRG